MKFECDKKLLQDAVAATSRAVPAQTTIEVLSGLLIEADDATQSIYITGYNNEMSIRAVVEAEVEEAGSLVVPARVFSDIVRKFEKDYSVEFSSDGNQVVVICGRARFNLVAMKASDFPEIPSVDDGEYIELDSSDLRRLVSCVSYAASADEARPIYTGILLKAENDEVTAVAVDGFRVATKTEKLLNTVKSPFSMVIPARAIVESARTLKEKGERVTILKGDKHVSLEMDGITLTARLFEGEFMDWRPLTDAQKTVTMKVVRKDFLASLERVEILVNEKLKAPVRLSIQDGSIGLSVHTATGKANDHCMAEGNCEEAFEIGFNGRYLIDAIKAAPSDEVELGFGRPIDPVVVKNADKENDSFASVVLPVRLH